MKVHWGYAIAIFFSLFVLTGIMAVVASKRYELGMVKKNYYDDDIGYQKIYDKKQNAKNLTPPIVISVNRTENVVLVTFPKGVSGIPVGKVNFLRPSKVASDFQQDIAIDSLQQVRIPITDNMSGYWKVSVDWLQNNIEYLHEANVVI